MINFYDINVYSYVDSVGTVMAYCTPAVYCDLIKRMNVLITSTRYMYMYVHLLYSLLEIGEVLLNLLMMVVLQREVLQRLRNILFSLLIKYFHIIMDFPLVYLLINCIAMWISFGNFFGKCVNCTKRLIRALHALWAFLVISLSIRLYLSEHVVINLPLSKSGLYFTPKVPSGKWCSVTLDQVSRSKVKFITVLCVKNLFRS